MKTPTSYKMTRDEENCRESQWSRKECNSDINYKKALDQNVSGTLTLSKPNSRSQTQSIYTKDVFIYIYIFTQDKMLTS